MSSQADISVHGKEQTTTKIGQPGFWTHRRKLGIVHDNFVAMKLIGPGLNLWKLCVETRGRVLRSIARRFSHEVIVAGAAVHPNAGCVHPTRHRAGSEFG